MARHRSSRTRVRRGGHSLKSHPAVSSAVWGGGRRKEIGLYRPKEKDDCSYYHFFYYYNYHHHHHHHHHQDNATLSHLL